MGWISAEQVEVIARPLSKNSYGQYLLDMVKRGVAP
jgi:glucose-1-phosphate thymidylyltransferase